MASLMSPSIPCHEQRSRLTIAIAFIGHGIGKLLVRLLVRREVRKEMPVNVATLKNLIETASSHGNH